MYVIFILQIVLLGVVFPRTEFKPREWIGKMNNITDKKKTALDDEIKRIKLIQQVTSGKTKAPIKLEEAAKGLINVDLEKLVPEDRILSELPPLPSKTPKHLEELERSFEKYNKNRIMEEQNRSKKTAGADNNVSSENKQDKGFADPDDRLKFHIVYMTPAKSPEFSPVLVGKPANSASRVIYDTTPEEWVTGDTPFNPDKDNDHSECIRITSGFYIGYFNHPEYGVHLKGHPEAKSMWGKNWGGAWGEGQGTGAKGLSRRILFVVDISNSLTEYDPVGNDRKCQRNTALKQTIVKNQENVDYGILFFHEKKKKTVDFVSYRNGSKVLYDSLNNYACRAEGGTSMTSAYEEAVRMFKNNRPFDTIILLTDQDEQTDSLEKLRLKHGGIKVITNRDELFRVMDHIVRL
jgi:hypothetical protein